MNQIVEAGATIALAVVGLAGLSVVLSRNANTAQHRPAGSMPNHPIVQALPWTTTTPYYDRGAAAVVQNFGKVLTNPIGAGIVALNRPQASYGRASEYHYGSLWWTSQNIPTSVDLTSLVSADDLSAALGPLNVQAAVRTTGG
jgi:hypothetical protein